MKFRHCLQVNWIKTLFFNLRYLPLPQAVRLPILLFRRTFVASVKGKIIIIDPVRFAMIKIGRNEVCGFEKEYTVIRIDGEMILAGKSTFGSGSVVNVSKNGRLTIGNNFRITAKSTIRCADKITFGDNVLISWENLFMDSDLHNIYSSAGELRNPPSPVSVGNHVWFACRCTILKGTAIPDNCVVAANSTLTRSFSEPSSVIGGAGSGQKVLGSNITWRE